MGEEHQTPSGNYLDSYVARIAKDAPIYLRIREQLRWQILKGEYKEGDRIPSEEEIAVAASTSRMTARRAVSDLVSEGLLHRRPGVGTFVVGRKFFRDPSYLVSFWESTLMLGMKPSSRLIDTETIHASADVAAALGLTEGDWVHHVRRVRQVDGEPIAYHNVHVPACLCPDLLQHDLGKESLYTLYRRYGHSPTSGEQRIEARAADEIVSELLAVPVGAPVLYSERITRDVYGTAIELLYSHKRADRYSIYMPLHL